MSNPKHPFDRNIICPITGEDLFQEGNVLKAVDSGNCYEISDGIPQMFVDPANSSATTLSGTTRNVQDFYTDAPFPNYNDFDDMRVFVARANKGIFARLLREQIPMNSKLLEVGCGTGQLSNYLAATTASHVYATDMTLPSLELGMEFASKNEIKGIRFIQMNLFYPCLKKHSMDIVISNGVLHHTADTKAAFLSISRLVKPGGYIIVGLYNKIGRLRTDLRRQLYKLFGEPVLFLDPHLRKDLSKEKRRAWIQDQYRHPRESKHTMSETLQWFAEAGFKFVSSIPKVIGNFSADEKIFEAKSPGSSFERVAVEVEMLLSHYGSEGGLYIMIGQKV